MSTILQTGFEDGDAIPTLNSLAFVESGNPRTGAKALRVQAVLGLFGITTGIASWSGLVVAPGVAIPLAFWVDGDAARNAGTNQQQLRVYWGTSGPTTLLAQIDPSDIPPGGGYFLWEPGAIVPAGSTLHVELRSQITGTGVGFGSWWVDDVLVGDAPAFVEDGTMKAEAFMDYLAAQGLGTAGVDMGVGFQPDAPDRFIALFDEAAPVIPDSHGFGVDNSGVQVVVRDTDYTWVRDKIVAIHKAVIGFSGDLGDGSDVTNITIAQNPASIGRDSQARAEWSAHYEVRFKTSGDAFRV